MTERKLSGASPAHVWEALPWKKFHTQVFRLQRRIAKAEREGKHGKVKSLQWILTHSFTAKALAVKRVTENQGGKTPGIDRIVWKTPEQKMQAISHLKRRGYKAKPLRRIYIPKKDGRQRPLSIPTILCRAQQALHLLALEPIVEIRADPCSYGFRKKRSTADALEQTVRTLSTRVCAQWVLEADIESCFDRISHSWIQDKIPMDKSMLNKWLKAGYIDQKAFHRTEFGVPQGSLISPAICVLTLSGLEAAAINCYHKRKGKINVVAYADDFIITGASREILEDHVKPAVAAFLKERGLRLSEKKTRITNIEEGFDFLGFNVRKYKGKLLTKPSKANIKSFYANLKTMVKSHPTATTEALIHMLNSKIIGWAYHFRHSCASKTFGTMDHRIFDLLWRWVTRRHSRESAQWKRKKYFRSRGFQNWVFTTKVICKDKAKKNLDLFEMGSVKIRRHTQVQKAANPFDPKFVEYFKKRDLLRKYLQEQDRKRRLKYFVDLDAAGLAAS